MEDDNKTFTVNFQEGKTIEALRAAPWKNHQDIVGGAAGLRKGAYIYVNSGTYRAARRKILIFHCPLTLTYSLTWGIRPRGSICHLAGERRTNASGALWSCTSQVGQGGSEATECAKGRHGAVMSTEVFSMKTKQDKAEGRNKNNNDPPGKQKHPPILPNRGKPHSTTNLSSRS